MEDVSSKDLMSDVELVAKIELRRELKDQVDILESKISGINKTLKDFLGMKGETSYIIPDTKHKISLTTVESNTFDVKKFKEVYPDLYKQFCSVSVTTRFNCN